jgi:hypothetical protein
LAPAAACSFAKPQAAGWRGWLLLQFGFNGPGHVCGLDLRLEALNDLAVAANEELGEVSSNKSTRWGRRPVLLLREVLLDVGQNFGGVLACVGDLVDFADGAALVDDERHPGRVPARAKHAERAGDLLLWIGEEGEVELFLVGEFLLFGERVSADADDDGVRVFE